MVQLSIRNVGKCNSSLKILQNDPFPSSSVVICPISKEVSISLAHSDSRGERRFRFVLIQNGEDPPVRGI
jgi:hypothetical protein